MQNKPNFRKSQMNVNNVLTSDYEEKNKPNSNPIQTQSNPIKAQKMQKQTQYKPNTKPNKPNFILSLPALQVGQYMLRFDLPGMGRITSFLVVLRLWHVFDRNIDKSMKFDRNIDKSMKNSAKISRRTSRRLKP
jgi:hypothetical protein